MDQNLSNGENNKLNFQGNKNLNVTGNKDTHTLNNTLKPDAKNTTVNNDNN